MSLTNMKITALYFNSEQKKCILNLILSELSSNQLLSGELKIIQILLFKLMKKYCSQTERLLIQTMCNYSDNNDR